MFDVLATTEDGDAEQEHALAADPVARHIARALVEHGFDREMTQQERLFVYLPFEGEDHGFRQAANIVRSAQATVEKAQVQYLADIVVPVLIQLDGPQQPG